MGPYYWNAPTMSSSLMRRHFARVAVRVRCSAAACDPSFTRAASASSQQRIFIFARPISTSTSRASSVLTAASHDNAVDPKKHYDGGQNWTTTFTAIDFSDSASAHGSKTTAEIVRAILVFQACRFPLLVKHAESLLNLSTKILGRKITNALVKATFFNHFCAGENSVDMKPVIDMLQKNNIGPILDYAAESEGSSEDGAISGGGILTQPPFNQPARIYDYKSEKECDRHVDIFKNCIHSVRDVSPHGFAALKVTALGNPELLERMSTMIVEVKNLFAKFDEKGTGLISREEFIRCYE